MGEKYTDCLNHWEDEVDFGELKGKTISRVDTGDEVIVFHTDDGTYVMGHVQDCCEDVTLESINGSLLKLCGKPLLIAYKSSSYELAPPLDPECDESFTWTFYDLATIDERVQIRWYGTSNGYYSEEVSFRRYTENEED